MQSKYKLASFGVRFGIRLIQGITALILFTLLRSLSLSILLLGTIVSFITLIKFGGTLTELLLQVRVVDINTKKLPSFWQAFKRLGFDGLVVFLGTFLSILFGISNFSSIVSGLSFLWILFNEDKQTLQDKVAGVIVVSISPNYKVVKYPLEVSSAKLSSNG